MVSDNMSGIYDSYKDVNRFEVDEFYTKQGIMEESNYTLSLTTGV